MSKAKLTAGRIAAFRCPDEAPQAFLWDADTPGLAIRATPSEGAKAFIFQGRLRGKSLRLTIGDVRTWDIDRNDPEQPGARQEARRLQALLDRGIDPREQEAEQAKQAEAARLSAEAKARQGSLLVADAWRDYLAHQRERMGRQHIERGKRWGERHMTDHLNLSQAGGLPKKRGSGTTAQGVLYPLLQMRMVDVTADTLQRWQAKEAATRANNARQGFEMFRAFWRWCAGQPAFAAAIDPQAVEGKALRDEVPSRKSKRLDVLQKSHLPAWFAAVRELDNPVMSAYLQGLLLTGARREELAALRWDDVDTRWGSLWIKDKVEAEGRKVPLTPYLSSLLAALPRRNQWVFSSPNAADGRINEPRIPHRRALAVAGLDHVTLHGLRRTFASLAEWVEMPQGVAAQIMGHRPSATAERHYINRPLDLLALWHCKYERWILDQSGVAFDPEKAAQGPGLRVVGGA